MNKQDENIEELTSRLILDNKEKAKELYAANKIVVSKNKDTEKKVAELIVANEENTLALISVNKKLDVQNDESEKRTIELVNAYKELKNIDRKLAQQKKDKEKRAAELIVANKELAFQNEEKEKRADELIIANIELDVQNEEKGKRAAELFIANKELAFQNEEKEKRAAELIVANKELIFQNEEKEKRAAELFIANKELAFQNEEKEKRAAELIVANKELIFQNKEKEKRAAELFIANKELAFQNEEKEKRAVELIKANNEFQQSEENFRRSISESPLGIRIISVDGSNTIYINKALLDIYGYKSLEEFRSIPDINRYTHESYVQYQKKKSELDIEQYMSDCDINIIRKNGEVRYIKAWIKQILWNEIKHYQVISLDITEQKQAEEALKESQQELRKFAMHLQNVREEEKIALAREMHDDLGQMLVALKIDLGLFKRKASKERESICIEEILSRFDNLSSMVDKTIKTTRRIMTGLRPEIIDTLGFIEAAKSYILEFEERYHLPCQFNCTIPELHTTSQQSVALFRILQEALNNVVKHAEAAAVKIHVSIQATNLILEIKDNGIGFDKDHKVRQDSYGMIGMKERVILLGGELTITGKPGKGTSVRVEMPYIS